MVVIVVVVVVQQLVYVADNVVFFRNWANRRRSLSTSNMLPSRVVQVEVVRNASDAIWIERERESELSLYKGDIVEAEPLT